MIKCHGLWCTLEGLEGSVYDRCSSCRWCICCVPKPVFATEQHQDHETLVDPTTSCLVCHRTWHLLRPHTHQCGSPCKRLWMGLSTNLFSPNHPLWPSHLHSTNCCISSLVDWTGTSLPSHCCSWTPLLDSHLHRICTPHLPLF